MAPRGSSAPAMRPWRRGSAPSSARAVACARCPAAGDTPAVAAPRPDRRGPQARRPTPKALVGAAERVGSGGANPGAAGPPAAGAACCTPPSAGQECPLQPHLPPGPRSPLLPSRRRAPGVQVTPAAPPGSAGREEPAAPQESSGPQCKVSTVSSAPNEIRTRVFRAGAPLLRTTIPVSLGATCPVVSHKVKHGSLDLWPEEMDGDVETVQSLSDAEVEDHETLSVTLDFTL